MNSLFEIRDFLETHPYYEPNKKQDEFLKMWYHSMSHEEKIRESSIVIEIQLKEWQIPKPIIETILKFIKYTPDQEEEVYSLSQEHLNIRALTEQIFIINYEPHATLQSLYEKVSQILKVPRYGVRLIGNDKVLPDSESKMINGYLSLGDVIRVVFNIKGD